MLKRVLRIFGWFFGILALILIVLVVYIRVVSKTEPPATRPVASVSVKVEQIDSGLYVLGNNWFRKSESGLYEMYVEGDALERGVAAGVLSHELVQYQETVFNKQIEEIVPSAIYRKVLLYLIGWFNRDIDEHVPEEYKVEIFGVSQSASHEFDHIALAYQRLLNYHAAHDIGHALQNMSLVGCTSFATWGKESQDSSLIIARNFDFYVGEEFARNKIVAFYNPDKGFKFMMVTFGGMVGVLSGMNEAGLTVTINAAKSEVPSGAATPVSLVAREILQYASTIDEAYKIAASRKMFVAESFMIGSAKDGRAAIIEKNTTDIAMYQSSEDEIVCTNHFQSSTLGNTELNREHVRTSASLYRYERVTELLEKANSVTRSAAILRDQRGLHDADIGMGNEKSVNQLIAHHSIIFQPEEQLVWISTPPWQLGKFVCYDLRKIFEIQPTKNIELYEADLTIPADSFLLTQEYHRMVKMNAYRFSFSDKKEIDPDSIMNWNKESYLAFMLAGDHFYKNGQYDKAIKAYQIALQKEVATEAEKQHIEEYLEKSKSASE